jgi:hypothetical protein
LLLWLVKKHYSTIGNSSRGHVNNDGAENDNSKTKTSNKNYQSMSSNIATWMISQIRNGILDFKGSLKLFSNTTFEINSAYSLWIDYPLNKRLHILHESNEKTYSEKNFYSNLKIKSYKEKYKLTNKWLLHHSATNN